MDPLEKQNEPITVMYLIDTSVSLPNTHWRGGAEKQLYLLASSLNSGKFKSLVVQLSPDDSLPISRGEIYGLELFHFPTRRWYGLSGVRQLGRLWLLAKKRKVHIIHTFFEKSEVMGWLTARLAGIPIWITSRRDLGFKRKIIYDKIFRFSSMNCNRCIANCDAVKNTIARQKGLPGDRIEVIYNGLDLSLYEGSTNHQGLRKELEIKSGIPLVGMIANFNFEIKGHVYFLRAAKKILDEIPNVKFVLVGDGPLRPGYEALTRELNIEKQFYFLGKRADVPSILSDLDISVLSSTSEGFSNVILESMAAGKPVIATDVGGSREMVINTVTGYLVPPADPSGMATAITALIQNPEKAKAMGFAGRKVVREKFGVEIMIKKYEELYSSLLSEKNKSTGAMSY